MNIYKIPLIDERWKTRKKSNLIKFLIKKSGKSIDDICAYLNYSSNYFNNKLNRNSFSLEDILLAAEASGFTVGLVSENEERIFLLDLVDFFGEDSEEVKRLERINKEIKEAKRLEYEEKKKELENLRKTYGFQ